MSRYSMLYTRNPFLLSSAQKYLLNSLFPRSSPPPWALIITGSICVSFPFGRYLSRRCALHLSSCFCQYNTLRWFFHRKFYTFLVIKNEYPKSDFQSVLSSAAKILLANAAYSSLEISFPFNTYFFPAFGLFASANFSLKFIFATNLSAPSYFSI